MFYLDKMKEQNLGKFMTIVTTDPYTYTILKVVLSL